jgi:queuosine precursor transporter
MKKNSYRFLPIISGLFVATLLISVSVAGKLFVFGPLILSASVLLFPLAFIFDDILTEVYGYEGSRRVIWTGFIAELLLVVAYQVTVILPPPIFFQDQPAFEKVLGQTPRIVVASLLAYFAGEFCNSFILSKMKVKYEGRSMPTRFIISTILGQGVDSFIFYPVAFFGSMPLASLGTLIFSAWGIKVLWEALALPISVPIAKALKKIEDEDVYDRQTNFNPFKL